MNEDVLKAGRWMHNVLLPLADGREVPDREQALAACENWEQKVREAGYNPRTYQPRAIERRAA